ncbi:MAG: hypothetical protein KA795_17175 [Burkholderiaceae bacterium]|jgi:hypothetical protein|nr:hypothetical protein [Burkholderiaceae bacterium]MBP8928784.1 hypothetical protein [Ottowia sp.]
MLNQASQPAVFDAILGSIARMHETVGQLTVYYPTVGRRHGQGEKHGTAGAADKGAPFGFEVHTNESKQARRALVSAVGRRQVIKQIKQGRRAAAADQSGRVL